MQVRQKDLVLFFFVYVVDVLMIENLNFNYFFFPGRGVTAKNR